MYTSTVTPSPGVFSPRAGAAAVAFALLAACVGPAAADPTNVTSVTLGPLTDGPDSTINGVTYLDQSLSFESISAGTIPYTFEGLPVPTVVLRRGGYAPPPSDTFGNYNSRNVVWSFGNPGDPGSTVRSGLPTTTESVLEGNNILDGADNAFTNADFFVAGSPLPIQTDVERIDFLLAGGVTVTPGLEVALFDRGGRTVHDGFQIAAILGLDGSGDPTAFGPLLSVAPGWGDTNLFPGGSPDDDLPYTVLTDSAGPFSVALDDRTQQVGGVLIELTDLAPSSSMIFGYALFAPDVDPGGDLANLLDVANAAVYPQGTTDSVGGLDLVAGSGRLVQVVPEPSSVTLLGVGVAGLLGYSRWRRRRRAVA